MGKRNSFVTDCTTKQVHYSTGQRAIQCGSRPFFARKLLATVANAGEIENRFEALQFNYFGQGGTMDTLAA
jgi:hypothetical protein